MKVTRNVILDLLPLYLADEVSAETRVLVNVREDLYSHWLEITPSPGGSRVAAWSDERRRIVVLDLDDATRTDLETEGRPRVLGFGPDGRRLCVVEGSSTLKVYDVATGRLLATRLLENDEAFLDPTGSRLLSLSESSKGWTVVLERIAWERLP